jgi:hypothetical protein
MYILHSYNFKVMGPIQTARAFIFSRIFFDVLGAFSALQLGAFFKHIKNDQNFKACTVKKNSRVSRLQPGCH